MTIKNRQIEEAAKKQKPGVPPVGTGEGSWCTDLVGSTVEGFYVDSAGRAIQITAEGVLNVGSLAGEVNTGANDGLTGEGIFNGKIGPVLHFKKLMAGSNVTLVPTTNGITINAVVPAASGEANTISNVGLSGVGLFKQKTGVNLELRRIKAGSNVSVAYSGSGDEIEISAVGTGGGSNTVVNLGTSGDGEGLYAQTVGSEFQFKRIKAGAGVTLTPGTDFVEVSVSASGTIIGGENVGASGSGVFKAVASGVMQFRKVVAGTNVEVVEGTDQITISATGTGSINNAANLGTVADGYGIYANKTTDVLNFYRIKAGSGILITQSGNSLVVTSTSAGGTITGATNLGTGSGSFAQVNGANLEFKSIKAGTNVTVTASATEVTVSASGDVNNASNLGSTTGRVGLWSDKSSGVLRFKSLVAGSGITLDTTVSGEVRIDATGGGGGEVNTASNLGTGSGVYAQKSGVDLQFKSIKAASSKVTVTSNSTEVLVDAVGDVNAGSNVGTGAGEIFKQKSGNALQFRKLKAGTNVTLDTTTEPDNIIVNAAGGGGGGGAVNGTRLLSFDGGNIVVRASGLEADLDAVTATKNYDTASRCALILNRPASVFYHSVHVLFTAAETVGRTEVGLVCPDANGATSTAQALRPFALRLNLIAGGIGATSSTFTLVSGSTFLTLVTGFTAAADQKASFQF